MCAYHLLVNHNPVYPYPISIRIGVHMIVEIASILIVIGLLV